MASKRRGGRWVARHTLLLAAGAVAVSLLVVFLIVSERLVTDYDADRYGTFAEWAAGLATAGAVVVALTAVVHESRERRWDELRNRFAEASRVALSATVPTFSYREDYAFARSAISVRNTGYRGPLREAVLLVDWSESVDRVTDLLTDQWRDGRRSLASWQILDLTSEPTLELVVDARFVGAPPKLESAWLYWVDLWGQPWATELGGLPEPIGDPFADEIRRAVALGHESDVLDRLA